MTQPSILSISDASRETCVNAITLRARERRYRLLCPTRSEWVTGAIAGTIWPGHRIRRLDHGVAISQVGALLRGTGTTQPVGPWKDIGFEELERGNRRRLEQQPA